MTRERTLKSGSVGSVGSAEFLPADHDLYSKLPETYPLEPWELRQVLFSLGYVDDLADEAEIAAAVEVAQADWPQWRAVRFVPADAHTAAQGQGHVASPDARGRAKPEAR